MSENNEKLWSEQRGINIRLLLNLKEAKRKEECLPRTKKNLDVAARNIFALPSLGGSFSLL